MTANKRRFPAEWEKQQGILMCFPPDGNDWPGKYDAVKWAFVEIIRKISEVEQVVLLVADGEKRGRVMEMLERGHVNLDSVSFILQKTDRSWMRDAGPVIVKVGEKREAINFNFNGWAKYDNVELDRQVPNAVAKFLDIPMTQAVITGHPVVLEGGAIDTNGRGTLLTSEECLLDETVQVRNPGFGREEYEAVFHQFLGITNTIWLGSGISGDDTHGHIDDLCRFVNQDTIVTVVESNPKDANYAALRENLKRLKAARLENGRQPIIVELPMPTPIVFDGVRLPASYANFLIINDAVLVPVFNDANDRVALNILADCFPDRTVIGIHAIDLVWGFGTLHCLTQQIPF